MKQLGCILTCLLLVACAPRQPQPVRHLHEAPAVDSALLQQMSFNQRMADAADRVCIQYIQHDSLTYAQDETGFWYSKTVRTSGTPLTRGQQLSLHIVMYEINGEFLSDIQDTFTLGSDNLPAAITNALLLMNTGEAMTLVAPWYTAYGVEGTSLVKPYTNLLIHLQL